MKFRVVEGWHGVVEVGNEFNGEIVYKQDLRSVQDRPMPPEIFVVIFVSTAMQPGWHAVPIKHFEPA